MLHKNWKDTCAGLLHNLYFREHWQVPTFAQWHLLDILNITKEICQTMFRDDGRIGGKLRRVVLSKWIRKSAETRGYAEEVDEKDKETEKSGTVELAPTLSNITLILCTCFMNSF